MLGWRKLPPWLARQLKLTIPSARCEWGAETYAAFRSLVCTAKANRASVPEVLRFVLAIKLPTKSVPGVG